ncbi:MAG: DUF4364 family protein, partial [Oscillospiraceae bacterium]
MDNNTAFTAGVRFGGLNDRTEIKILICYLLSAVNQPLKQELLIDTIVGQELVNYFELQSALPHLLDQGFITESDGAYSITCAGVDISQELEKSLPFSVRERAYKAAIELLQYEALKKQNKTSITPLTGGGFNLNCTIADEQLVLFSFDVFMPDEKSAKFAQERFIKHGQDIFKCVLGITTDNPSM